MRKLLAKLLISTIAASTLIPSIAIADLPLQVVLVAGKTHDGSRISFKPADVQLNNRVRSFKYAVIRPTEEIRST